jgi:hypothetical protein
MKTKRKKQKKQKNIASLCFASKQKLLNRSVAKKSKKKRKNRLEFRFALFHFEAKITKVKQSKKFEAKISKNKRKKRSEIL